MAKISICQEVNLFLKNYFNCLGDKANKTKDLISRWLIIGQDRLDREFDVVQILKRLRTVKLISKRVGHDEIQRKLDKENFIAIDSEDLSESEEESPAN